MKKAKGLYTIVFTCIFLLLIFLLNHLFFSPPMIFYPDFGISIPSGYSIYGIDVSHHQQDINWEQVANMRSKSQKISFAFIKATEGISLTDENFKYNWKHAKKAGLKRGAYLYFHPNMSGQLQAQYFINKVKLEKNDFAPVVDIEENFGANASIIQKNLSTRLTQLEDKYGIKPIIYTNVDYYERFLSPQFDQYPLWAAHYEQQKKPRIKRAWQLWQFNCEGNVNGIEGFVDFNVLNGAERELFELSLH